MASFDTPREAVDPEALAAAHEPPEVADDVPEADALEQRNAVVADDEEEPPSSVEPELEANPADVDEQRRVVIFPDDEPLPDEQT